MSFPPGRILVADDAPEVARRVAELLLEAGAVEVVGPASDGTEALELFETAHPDAAILDLSMPGASGLEVLRAIRARGRPCFVVILTNHARPVVRDACLAAGADHFLDKGTEVERLPELVTAWLESPRP